MWFSSANTPSTSVSVSEVHVDSLWYCEYFAPTGQVGSVEAPAADKGSSSEENLDLSETPQRISKDLVGL